MEQVQVKSAESPAEVYERDFVPALFGPWATRVAEIAGVAPGEKVLDVACGTGVLARAVRARTGAAGEVTGLDAGEEMLAVARQRSGEVRWVQGLAESLPFDDCSFDRVVSQFGLMFFSPQEAALREMHRVLRPGGRLTVAVCDGLDHSPGYAVLTELLHRLFGAEVAEAFRAPFASGDRDLLRSLAKRAELHGAEVTRHDGQVRFPSIGALVAAERACAWTLGGLLDAAQFERLREAALESLAPFTTAQGEVAFDMPILVLSAEHAP